MQRSDVAKKFSEQFKIMWDFPGGSGVKNLPAVQETWVLSLGQEDHPGGGLGNSLQYSCLENPMDRGAWWATAHAWSCKRVRHNLGTQQQQKRLCSWSSKSWVNMN